MNSGEPLTAPLSHQLELIALPRLLQLFRFGPHDPSPEPRVAMIFAIGPLGGIERAGA
jgi:hypothetical protein